MSSNLSKSHDSNCSLERQQYKQCYQEAERAKPLNGKTKKSTTKICAPEISNLIECSGKQHCPKEFELMLKACPYRTKYAIRDPSVPEEIHVDVDCNTVCA